MIMIQAFQCSGIILIHSRNIGTQTEIGKRNVKTLAKPKSISQGIAIISNVLLLYIRAITQLCVKHVTLQFSVTCLTVIKIISL